MVMSPEMIQQILLHTPWVENDISRKILVPCLHSYSVRNGYRLRDVRFTGGGSELGNDIQYYELLGPDLLRFYTGIQLKKGDVTQSSCRDLIRQGEEAFGKDIDDIGTGQSYRINRWVVAATGKVTDPAQREIMKNLDRYAKPVHFWDGTKIGDLIMTYFYREFIEVMGIDAIYAASDNIRSMLFDPDSPITIAKNFSSDHFTVIDTSRAAPGIAAGLLLTVKPTGKNLPSTQCIVRSACDEITIDSVQSQLQPYLLRMNPDDEVEAMVLDTTRTVDILARGYMDIL